MKILLFQWSQVSRHPKCKRRSMHGFQDLRLVSILIFFYYANTVSLLKLLKFTFYNFFTAREIFNGRERMIIVQGGFGRITL
jgi:hypothetical protein